MIARRPLLLRPSTAAAPVALGRLTLRAACGVLVANHVVLAVWHHTLAAACVDAVTLVLLLNAGVARERRSGDRDDVFARAYAALALAAAAPVAGAALPLRHVSEGVGTIAVALPVAAAAGYLASRQGIPLRPLAAGGRPLLQVATLTTAGALGFCATILKAPTIDRGHVGPLAAGVAALLLAAVAEELLFRGLLQRSLGRTLGLQGVAIATAVSAALYTGDGWWIVPTLGAFAAFAILVAATNAVATAVAAHAAFTVGAAVVWPALLGGQRPSSLVWPPICIFASFALPGFVAAATRAPRGADV